jgi:hypothetical protein
METMSSPGTGVAAETGAAETDAAGAAAAATLLLVASAAVVAVAGGGAAATTTPRQAVRESRAASGIAAEATVVTEGRIEVTELSEEMMKVSIN